MARKRGDLSRYISYFIDESQKIPEPYKTEIRDAETKNNWHSLLCPDCHFKITRSNFGGKRRTLPSIKNTPNLTPENEELLIWQISRIIIGFKEEDEKANLTGHAKDWKRKAIKKFDVTVRTIDNWVREYNIYTRDERYAALRPKAIASLKKMRKSE